MEGEREVIFRKEDHDGMVMEVSRGADEHGPVRVVLSWPYQTASIELNAEDAWKLRHALFRR